MELVDQTISLNTYIRPLRGPGRDYGVTALYHRRRERRRRLKKYDTIPPLPPAFTTVGATAAAIGALAAMDRAKSYGTGYGQYYGGL